MRTDGYSGSVAAQKGRILGWLDDLCIDTGPVTFQTFDDDEELGPQLVVRIPLNRLWYVHLSCTHLLRDAGRNQKAFVGWGMIGSLCHVRGRACDLHDSNESNRLELARILVDAARKMPAADNPAPGKVKGKPPVDE